MIKRRLRRLKNLNRLRKLILNGGFGHHEIIELGREHEFLDEAKRLHASVYLYRNFVSPEDIDEDGRLHHQADPHQKHAHYFIAVERKDPRKTVVATARQIEVEDEKGMNSFPILEKSKVYKRAAVEISAQDPKACIEVSGLAKRSGTGTEALLLLYRQMWHRSLRDGQTMWLMACDVRLYDRLKLLFDGAITRIGPRSHYQGGDVIPAMLRPYEGLSALITATESSRFKTRAFRRGILRFLYEGYPKELLEPGQIRKLKKLGIIDKND